MRFEDPLPVNSIEQLSTVELIGCFEKHGLPLATKLQKMLLEQVSPIHSLRYGSGFTQASHFLSQAFQGYKDLYPMSIFNDSVLSQICNDFSGTFLRQDILAKVDRNKLLAIEKEMTKPETKLFAKMIADIFGSHIKDPNLPELPIRMIGITFCTSAEMYFYNFLENNFDYPNRRPSDYSMNLVVDQYGEPMFWEKVGLGEEHSAISLKPFYLGKVEIPSGSLVGINYENPNTERKRINSNRGEIIQLAELNGVEFLRFTPLVLEPKDRTRVFVSNLEDQAYHKFKRANSITVDDFIIKAKEEIKGVQIIGKI